MDVFNEIQTLLLMIFLVMSHVTSTQTSNEDKPVSEILERAEQKYPRYPASNCKHFPVSTAFHPPCHAAQHRFLPYAFQSAPAATLTACSSLDLHILQLVAQHMVSRGRIPAGPDPYFFQLLQNHMRLLPYGLGPQGIYGSTGLPAYKPPGVFRVTEKAGNE